MVHPVPVGGATARTRRRPTRRAGALHWPQRTGQPEQGKGVHRQFFPVARISHSIDETGSIPIALGGTFGVPQTFFFAPGGELLTLHAGVIDERTLALQLDEILARAP